MLAMPRLPIVTALFERTFLNANNLENLIRRTALYAILGIGVDNAVYLTDRILRSPATDDRATSAP